MALCDYKDVSEVRGYCKLSITVLGPEDEQYVHSAESEDDEAEGMVNTVHQSQCQLMMPCAPSVVTSRVHGKCICVPCYARLLGVDASISGTQTDVAQDTGMSRLSSAL